MPITDDLPPGATPPSQPRPEPVPTARSPRVAALADRVNNGDGGAVPAFWAEVGERGTPLVEPHDADTRAVTFLWRGAARTVLLLANKLFDRANPRDALMRQVPGTDVWHLTYRLPADWRGSYQIAATGTEPADDDELRALAAAGRPDPFNPAVLPQPDGAPDKSVAELPDAPPRHHLGPRPGTPTGTVTAHRIGGPHPGGERDAWLYAPAQPAAPVAGPVADQPVAPVAVQLPLLVLLDGEIWARRLPVFPMLDNLIADGTIPPLAAVVLAAGGRITRFTEYPCDDRFAAYLAEDVTPWAADRLGATADPAATIVAGQSLGGLAAAYAAYRAPHRFGNVLSQSGSFWWPNAPGAEWLTARYAAADRLPLRFHLEVGRDEWTGIGPNRRLRDALNAKGYPVTYTEYSGGHDQACWQVGLAGALHALTSAWRQ